MFYNDILCSDCFRISLTLTNDANPFIAQMKSDEIGYIEKYFEDYTCD